MTSKNLNKKDFLNQVMLLAVDLYASRIISGADSIAENPPNGMDKSDVEQATLLAQEELKKPKVKKAVCLALKSATNDIREIAKIVGATLLPLSLSGIISLPLTPLAFAAAAVIIFDAGVSTFCAE